jgi:hypothetical protein
MANWNIRMGTTDIEKALLACFDQLDQALHKLSNRLPQEMTAHWQPEGVIGNHIQTALTDYWYDDNRDGRITTPYLAVVQVDPSVLSTIDNINTLKRTFSKLCSGIGKSAPSVLPVLKSTLAHRHQTLHHSLQPNQLSRLHIKQLTRTIPTLPEVPEKVAFNWYTSGRSITHITKQDAWRRLCGMNQESKHIQIQLQDLARLPDNEPLAVVQVLAPIMRINVRFANRDRKAQNIALPLFIPNNAPMPEIVPPPESKPETRTRKRRSDNVLEDHPFLKSLRVYRYRT